MAQRPTNPITVLQQFLDAFTKFRKATIRFAVYVSLSVRPSVRMEQLGSHRTDMEFSASLGFENLSRKFKFL